MYYYLVRSPSKVDQEEDLKDLQDKTPLIPSFPVEDVDCNYFVGINTHGKVRNAKIVQLDLDPDDLLKEAVATYLGIPQKLLESYITETLCLIQSLPRNVYYQCIVEGPRCTLRSIEENRQEYVLWQNNDPKKYL